MKIDYLYEKYKKDVYYFLYHLSQNSDIAQDLTATVFVSVLKALPAFKGESNIKTWIFSIARFTWIEFLRKEKRLKDINEKISLYVSEVDLHNNQVIENKEIAQRILELLNNERDNARKIILMRVEGFSFYEIAKELEISQSSARVIDFRTKNKIKEILFKEGYYYE